MVQLHEFATIHSMGHLAPFGLQSNWVGCLFVFEASLFGVRLQAKEAVGKTGLDGRSSLPSASSFRFEARHTAGGKQPP